MAAKTYLKSALTISLLFLVLAFSTTAHAKIIYVDDDAPADFSNIQAAIDGANDGDIIIVNPGTYTGDGNRDIDFKGKAITVRSTDPNDPNIVAATVIDCEGSDEDYHRGFYFRSGEDENSILEGLTITNGLHSTGAGICCLGSSPTIRNNIITGNETGFDEDGGAGIGCWNGASPIITNNIISDNICAPGGGGGGIRCYDWCSPAITNCTFSRNSPGGMKINNSNPTISNCTFEGNLGGGVSSSSFSSSIFINCTFIGNSSPSGGGMRIYESNPTLINCSFIQNVAATRGGGIWIYGWDTASPTLINCTFAGNLAANYGGGMYNRDSTRPTLVNCTFTGNSADDAGGAVYNYGYDWSVRITLNNCTFSGNSAANGNDLACDSPYGPPSNVEITNCILWDGGNPIWNNDGSTITITYSDVHGGWPGQGNIDAAPCFVDPDGDDNIFGTEDDNLRLLPGSPCIDAGDPNYVTEPNETDLDGKPRVIAGRIDMGAYEFLSQMILYVDNDATGANDGSSWADAFNLLQDALATAYYGDEIRVAQGVYKPDQGAGITPGDREETFQLINGVTLKGGFAGAGTSDPNARDIQFYETILTGDLLGNDDPDDRYTKGENSYHVVTGTGTDETAVLDGFIITGGNANGSNPKSKGGGLFNYPGSLIVDNCTFTGNYAIRGGGMYNHKGSCPKLTECKFIQNLAGDGAGMYNNYYSRPTLTNCFFSDNRADRKAGAAYYSLSNSTLTNCTFTQNSAEYEGGAMYIDRSDLIMVNCSFIENSAPVGGGLYNYDSDPVLSNCVFSDNFAHDNAGGVCNEEDDEECSPMFINCTFSGNRAGENGGGMYNVSDCSVTLKNCTFSGNSAIYGGGVSSMVWARLTLHNCTLGGNLADNGGAVYNASNVNAVIANCTFAGNSAYNGNALACDSPYGPPSSVQVTNCVIWDGENPIWNNDGSTITITYSDVHGGWPGQGNIDVDPLFVDAGKEDYHLLEDSPCIDAGDPNYITEPNETDLDGKPRVLDGDNDSVLVVDMGAYEYRFTISAEARIVPQTINLASKGNWITCYIWLPEQYNVADMEPNSIFLEDEIKPEQFSVDEQQQVATARFSREEVQPILEVGDINLKITGQLTDAIYFEATDTIKVINKAGKN